MTLDYLSDFAPDSAYVEFQKDAVVGFDRGLHGRPTMEFIDLVDQYKGVEFEVDYKGAKADGFSIAQLMSLMVPKGETIRITAKGFGARAAAEGLADFVEKGKTLC